MWKETFDGVGKLIRGSTAVSDYEVFRGCFEEIRNLIKGISIAVKDTSRLQGDSVLLKSPEKLSSAPTSSWEVIDLTVDESKTTLGLADLRVITKDLAIARIRGSFTDLRTAHHSLLETADSVINIASPLPQGTHLSGVI